jgi:hypothetical protein
MPSRVIVFAVAVIAAYGVGLMSDWTLNDDPCIEHFADEDVRVEPVERWLPARTDCRITTASGVTRIERGSAEVFLSMFVLTLVAAMALLSGVALLARVAVVAAAGATAFAVIFII